MNRLRLYLVLVAVFVAHALLAEVVGGKLMMLGGLVVSMGTLVWPVVFVTTDLLNEYYGLREVRRVSLTTVALIVYAFLLLTVLMSIPAASGSPVSSQAFTEVYGQSRWIIAGSVVAFLVSQLVDAGVFACLRDLTRGRRLWLRALGSTLVSQLVDTYVVNAIGFGLSGRLPWSTVFELSTWNYLLKVAVAVATVPVLYGLHWLIERMDEEEGQVLQMKSSRD